MTLQDWEVLGNAIEEKALRLMRHEKKDFAKTGLDLSNYEEIIIGKRAFYAISTPVFRAILEEVLPEATRNYPDLFGTGRAEDVVQALYQTRPFGKAEKFATLLGHEQFCYVLEVTDGQLNEGVLRIDLFRDIKQDEKGSGFVGGIFHAFKHFSYDGIPLFTGQDQHDIQPSAIVFLLTKAFFWDAGTSVSDKEYKVRSPWDGRYDIQYAFYYEPLTAVYFVNTAFKVKHKPNRPR